MQHLVIYVFKFEYFDFSSIKYQYETMHKGLLLGHGSAAESGLSLLCADCLHSQLSLIFFTNS